MAQGIHFCDTHGAKHSLPPLRHDAAHANANSMIKFGFCIGWPKEAIFEAPMMRNTHFLH
jgi:hypothetical protein